MRDNYVGDISDYYKYGLLRYIIGCNTTDKFPPLTLGIAWYLYPDPCKLGDGLHLDYLKLKHQSRFRHLDPILYDSLNRLVENQARLVKAAERQITERLGELRDHLKNVAFMGHIYFPSYGGQIFFILGSRDHVKIMSRRLAALKACYRGHIRN